MGFLPQAIKKDYANVDDITPTQANNIGKNLEHLAGKKGVDLASAAVLVLGSDGNYFDITGTTNILFIDPLGIGSVIKLHFDAVLTITHHATDLVLPNGKDITTYAGMELEFIEYDAGRWRATGGLVDADTVDGVHASSFPESNKLLALDANGKFPANITSQPSFSVHKNGIQQTTSGLTKVTWSTEVFDTNNNFASDKFTPTVAGKYLFTIQIAPSGWNTGTSYDAYLYKNGASISKTSFGFSTDIDSGSIVFIDSANGTTDFYEVYVVFSNNFNILGSTISTYFQGCRIG